MAETSDIEWTDATWNPITGCSVVSPGCTNCYAMRLAGTRLRHHHSREGLTQNTKAGPVWTGEVRLNNAWLAQPLRWTRPRRIFVCAHSDLFHESVPDDWIDQVFAVMALAPQHTFQVLTKRAARMRAYLTSPQLHRRLGLAIVAEWDHPRNDGLQSRTVDYARGQGPDGQVLSVDGVTLSVFEDHAELTPWPLPNVWLGVSAEDQTRADERIPELLATPAAVRFASLEPLLGPIDLRFLDFGRHDNPEPVRTWFDALTGDVWSGEIDACRVARAARGGSQFERGLDWVIAGGESQTGSRPAHPDWIRAIRDACIDVGVPFFFKQWGDWAPGECSNGPPTRSQNGAAWFDDGWDYSTWTPTEIANTHCDDEPDVWRLGKKVAGRTLDGRTWDQMLGEANPVRGRA